MSETDPISIYEAELFARGKMVITEQVAGELLVLSGEDPDLPGAEYDAEVWAEAFENKVPLGWQDPKVAAQDIIGAGKNRLSKTLILAGVTHPTLSVKLAAALSRPFSVTELAVALVYNTPANGVEIVRRQRQLGITDEVFRQAIVLVNRVAFDSMIKPVDLISGNF
jgi:hypothetical protein